MSDIFVELEYDIKLDKFEIKTNAKDPLNILEHYLRSVMGKGKDTRESKKLNKYKIRVEIDLSYDNISCESNTENDGLTAGIIMRYIRQRS